MPSEELLRRYAELVVRVGLNLREGQDLHVSCYVEHAPLARAATAAAYDAGARRVMVIYRDELETFGVDVVHTLTRSQPPGWTGYDRRIDDDLLREVAYASTDAPRVYVCGSTRFVDAAADGLVRLGYDPRWIRTERFGATG